MPIPQTAKQIAIQAAKQTAREGNEFLKIAREQLSPPIQEAPKEPAKPKEEPKQEPKPQNLNYLNSYKSELEEIRRDNLFKELQKKVQEGEFIPLENYIKELSFEQREVLKAQMEAVEMQKQAAIEARPQSIPEIVGKRAKGMLGTFKKRNQQHVEMRQPPSN